MQTRRITSRIHRVLVTGLCIVTSAAASAIPISNSDLWDLSQGAVLTATSGALNYHPGYASDARNALGGVFGTIEAGNLLFKDYNAPGATGGNVAPGFVHFIEWETPAEIMLRSFSLHAYNEGMLRRAFNRFTLYGRADPGDAWNVVYDTGAGYTYGPGQLDLTVNVTPLASKYFRAEFVQNTWSDPRAVGPRIQEIDGYDFFQQGLPVPQAIPEPGVLGLVLAGLAGRFGRRRHRSRTGCGTRCAPRHSPSAREDGRDARAAATPLHNC
jgi:hypothetical protein